MNHTDRPVLFVLEHFHPYLGGVEQLFLQLTRALVSEGVAVTVVTTRHHPSLPLREICGGVRIRRVRARNRYLFTLLAFPVALCHAFRARVVCTSTYNAALPAFLAATIARKRAYITVHEIWGPLWFRLPWLGKFSASLHNLFEKFVIRLPFHRYIAVSEFTGAALADQGIPPEKVKVICNGLDYKRLDQYRQNPTDSVSRHKPCFIYYGRLGHSKGLDLIVSGGALFMQLHPECAVELIVPEVPKRFRKRLGREIAKSGAKGEFLLTGSLPPEELFRKIQAATAVLIPSYSEGFCYVAAECTALGVPMVSSGQGALRETAGGRVVHISPLTPEGLCEAMEKAYAGQFNNLPVRRFPLEDQVQQYLELLRR
jgi:glycosyltransferase involved in cell wall biosynthesis